MVVLIGFLSPLLFAILLALAKSIADCAISHLSVRILYCGSTPSFFSVYMIGEEARNAILSGQAKVPKESVEQLIEIKQVAPEFIEPVLKGEITLSKAIQETKRKQVIEKLNNIETKEVKELEGIYDVVVIDPPWPIEKIERDIAPNQVKLDYPTMTIDEIKELKIPCADNCHVWLWTTQKYLPAAFEFCNSLS